MKRSLLFIFIFGTVAAHAQIIRFQKSFGLANRYRAYDVQVTQGGGYIFAGTEVDTVIGNYSDLVIRTNSSGAIQWQKNFTENGQNYFYSIEKTQDGGFVLAGNSNAGMSAPNVSTYIVKVDSTGNLLWSKIIDAYIQSEVFCIKETSDNGFIMTGYENDSLYGSKLMMIKIDSASNLIWANAYGAPVQSKEFGFDVVETNDGGYVAIGTTGSYGAGDDDIYIVKADVNGNFVWGKTFGGVNYDYGYGVSKIDNENNLMFSGTIEPTTSGDDLCLFKTDANGNLIWSKHFQKNNFSLSPDGLIQKADGSFVISGTSQLNMGTTAQAFLINTDASGNLLWSKNYSCTQHDEGAKVRETSYGGLVLVGNKASSFYNGQIYLVKTDASGNSGCNEATLTVNETPAVLQIDSGGQKFPFGVPFSPATEMHQKIVPDSVLCFTVGVDEKKDQADLFLLYPNPANNNFNLEMNANANGKIKIALLDATGKEIRSEEKSVIEGKNYFTMDVSNLSGGIYLVQIIESGIIHTEKISVVK